MLCNDVYNLNLDVKDNVITIIRLRKTRTDGDTGDTEQKPILIKVVMKHTSTTLECFNLISNLREAENKYKCLRFHLTKQRGRKETPRGGQVKIDN